MATQYQELVRSFLAAQRMIRSLGRHSEKTYDLAVSNILISLEQESYTPGQLADRLRITKSKVTRSLKVLEQSGLILVTPSRGDARSRTLCLTQSGRKAVSAIDQTSNSETASWASTLKKKEQKLLHEFLQQLADTLGASETQVRPSELPLRTQQRRIAQTGGLLGGRLLHSSIPLIEYHILQELAAAENTVALETIFSFPFDPAQLSRCTDVLVRCGWIAKHPDPNDRRRMLVEITRTGLHSFLAAEKELTRLFARIPCLKDAQTTKSLTAVLNSMAGQDTTILAAKVKAESQL